MTTFLDRFRTSGFVPALGLAMVALPALALLAARLMPPEAARA